MEEVAGKELAVLVGIAASFVRQVASFESVVVGGIAGRGSGYQCKPHFLFVLVLQEELLVVVEVDWLEEVGAVQLVVVEVVAVAEVVALVVVVEQQLDWCTIDTSKDHLVSTSAGEV